MGSTLRLAKAGCKRDYIIPSMAGTLIEDGWRCETNQQRKETGNRLEELKQRKRQVFVAGRTKNGKIMGSSSFSCSFRLVKNCTSSSPFCLVIAVCWCGDHT